MSLDVIGFRETNELCDQHCKVIQGIASSKHLLLRAVGSLKAHYSAKLEDAVS